MVEPQDTVSISLRLVSVNPLVSEHAVLMEKTLSQVPLHCVVCLNARWVCRPYMDIYVMNDVRQKQVAWV